MPEWEQLLQRFEEGELEAPALGEALGDPALEDEGVAALSAALGLAEGLGTLLAPLGLAPDHVERLAELLPPAPPARLLEDDDGADLAPALADLLGGLGRPPRADELGLGGERASEALSPLSANVVGGSAAPGLRRLLVEAVEVCGASEATLWRVDDGGGRLVGALNHVTGGAPHAALEGLSVPVAASAIGEVATSGRGLHVGAADYQDPVATWTSGVEVTAMIAVPVRVLGRVRGVLSAINPAGRQAFSAEDLEALTWKAYLLGLVLTEACVRERVADPFRAE
jgi:hypothetical protein